MKVLFENLKKSHWAMKLFYILTVIGYFTAYGFFVKSLLNLEGIETTIRIILIIVFLLYGLLYLIFGAKKMIQRKKVTFIILTIFSIIFIVLLGFVSFSINKIYNKIENFTTKETSTYTTVILAKKETEFTNNSTIGIITDETDRTGYILPMEWIKKENIKILVLSEMEFTTKEKPFLKSKYIKTIMEKEPASVNYFIEDDVPIIRASMTALPELKVVHVSTFIK